MCIQLLPHLSLSLCLSKRISGPPSLLKLSSMRLFVIIIALTVVHVPTSVSAKEKFLNCSTPFSCANIQDIDYPFSGSGRADYCGYPGYELRCEGEAPEITISDRTFRVLNISSTSRILTVARQDYWADNCPSNLVNTTVNFSLFSYTSDTENVTLYYNCPSLPSQISPLLLPYGFNCSSDGADDNNYYLPWGTKFNDTVSDDAIWVFFLGCANSVFIPVLQSTLVSIANNPASVNLTRVLDDGFGLQWSANYSLCDECKQSNGKCGYNTSTLEFTCYCPDQPYPVRCPSYHSPASPGTSRLNSRAMVAIGVAAGLSAIVIMSVVFYMHRKKKFSTVVFYKHRKKYFSKNQRQKEDIEAIIKQYGFLAPKRYNYSDVKKMTNSFTNKVGQGGYGVVYKGKLPDGRVVAVKVLSKSEGNGEEFLNEVACISRTSHINIVTLLGFCYERTKRALIYEFLSNGSLDKFIYDQGSSNASQLLEWKTLNQIVIGVARGLEYLHRGCNTRIVHFDIKPHNILLDDEFCPKIADFGLAKLCKKKESIISMLDARGTIGYIAPEVICRSFGGVSHKSDVYGFGMMVLEIVGVRKNNASGVSKTSSEIYFPDWIYKKLEPGKDLTVHGIVAEEEEVIARKMILVSLWCIQTNPSDRPSMSKVVEMLEGSLESLQVPPKPSMYSSPVIAFQQSSSTSASLS